MLAVTSAQRLRSKLQEDLVSLYMRLNGFFVTGFIVHSTVPGRNRTELDALALRMPFSAEPEREVGLDPLLDLSARFTDLALCEVKSKGQSLQFNAALNGQPSAVAPILRWSGLFRDSELDSLSSQLAQALTPQHPAVTEAPTIAGPRKVRIRGLLFCPERDSRRANQPWFVTGPDIFGYVWKCLCPGTARPSCATVYDFQAWGNHELIVRYFKSRPIERGAGDFEALCEFVTAQSSLSAC